MASDPVREALAKDLALAFDLTYMRERGTAASSRDATTIAWLAVADRVTARAALSAPLPTPAPPTDAGREGAVVKAIRDYVVAAIATCREAEDARLSDMGKRAENHAIMDMLREQHFAWSEKARSYEALLAFIDALVPREEV